MPSKTKLVYCNPDECCRSASLITPSHGRPYDCRQRQQPLCQQIDVRLAQLHFDETGCSATLEQLKALSRTVETGLVQVNHELAFGALTLPETSRDFLQFLQVLHHRIFAQTGLRFAGQFRKAGEPKVAFGHRGHQLEGMPPEQIEKSLSHLFDSVVNCLDYATVEQKTLLLHTARFLEQFFRIHPFHDGNGRVGRLIIRLMALTTERFVFQSFPEDKKARKRYLYSLQHAHRWVDRPVTPQHRPAMEPLMQWLDSYLDEVSPEAVTEASPPEWLRE